jgi:hypothetical protein
VSGVSIVFQPPSLTTAGVLFLLPGLPLFVSLIGGSEVVFLVLVRIVNVFPFLSRIVPFVTERCARFGSRFMKDPRDGAFFLPIVALTVWGPLLFSWAVYRYQLYGFEISTVFLYHFLRLMPRYRMFAYMYVLVHKEGHSRTGFWKWDVLNFGILNYFAGIFYGDCCNSFPMAHNKIHHAYDNDLDDVHTNLDLDRSRPISFLYYVPRFALYWAGLTPLVKFAQKSQWTFFWVRKSCCFVFSFSHFPPRRKCCTGWPSTTRCGSCAGACLGDSSQCTTSSIPSSRQ